MGRPSSVRFVRTECATHEQAIPPRPTGGGVEAPSEARAVERVACTSSSPRCASISASTKASAPLWGWSSSSYMEVAAAIVAGEGLRAGSTRQGLTKATAPAAGAGQRFLRPDLKPC